MQVKKERVAPRLVGSMRVNEMLGLAGHTHVSQEPLADILEGVGIEPAGEDGSGNLRWSEKAVEGALERIKDAIKKWRTEQAEAAARPSPAADLDAIERAVRSAVERYVTPAQKDIDEALERLQEQQRALFRLVGEVVDMSRNALKVANSTLLEVQSGNAKTKDMIVGLGKDCGDVFSLMSDEAKNISSAISQLSKSRSQ